MAMKRASNSQDSVLLQVHSFTSDTGGGKKGASTGQRLRRLIVPGVQPLSGRQRDAKEGVEPGLPLLREVLDRYMKCGQWCHRHQLC